MLCIYLEIAGGEEEFVALLITLWLGWRNRNAIAHGKVKVSESMEVLKMKLSWMLKEIKGGTKELCWWEIQADRVVRKGGFGLQMECKAIHIGLQLAKELNLTKVKIYSDSREALWAVSVGNWRPDACIQEIKACISELDDKPRWQLGGTDRDCNVMADWLARKARSGRWRWSWRDSTVVPFGLSFVL
ncbi:hypothetical protein QQ045_001031 [Rhodiola kirilowii]